MSKKPSALKRLVVFFVGIPGYLFTLFPWMFVSTLVLLLVAQYTMEGDVSFDYIKLQFESIVVAPGQAILLGFLSLGLWVFMAWFAKRVLLWISTKFGETERVWQITKVAALLGGWVGVSLIAGLVFQYLNGDFIVVELVLITIGLVSIGFEYALSRLWLLKN